MTVGSFFRDCIKTLATFLLDIILFIIQIPILNAVIRFFLRILKPRKDVLMNLHGFKVYANTIDRIVAIIFWKFSNSEEPEHNLIKDHVREGMCVVDIGANIGYHTLQLAQCVGEKGKVYAFEPDPDNYRLLVKNIEANQCQNVVAVQKAISDRSGLVSLYVSEENKGDHRIFNSQDNRKSIEVETVVLDQYLKDIQEKVDLIKIDTQGAECLVLSGIKDLVEKNEQMLIICEFVPSYLIKCGFSPEELLSQIRDLGFNIYTIDKTDCRLIPANDERLLRQYRGEGRYTNLVLKKY